MSIESTHSAPGVLPVKRKIYYLLSIFEGDENRGLFTGAVAVNRDGVFNPECYRREPNEGDAFAGAWRTSKASAAMTVRLLLLSSFACAGVTGFSVELVEYHAVAD